MFLYRIAGLNVLSDYALLSLGLTAIETGRPNAKPDVVIDMKLMNYEREISRSSTPQDFIFFARRDLAFRIEKGESITIYCSTQEDRDSLETTLFLMGSAWGVLCHQRGLLPLHCSAIEVQGGAAVAFIAPSGGGKSTLAAHLSLQGYRHVCDDVAICDFAGTHAALTPMPKGLKLWREAAEALDLKTIGHVTNDGQIDKFYIEHGAWAEPEPLKLKAIYQLLFTDPKTGPTITKLGGAASFTTLYENVYRIEWSNQLQNHSTVSRRLAEIANTVPVFQFSRAKSFQSLSETSQILCDHFEAL